MSATTLETIEFLKRAYEREKKAKQEAERIIEEKSTELYFINRQLEQLNNSLEQKVQERTRQLQLAQQKAEKLATIKQQFLANMSHEIRTPMNAIIGFTDLLSKSRLDEKQSKYLKAIERSAENLLVIINDILDLSKIEEGKVPIEYIDVNLKLLVESLLNTFKDSNKKSDLRITHEIDNRIDIVKSDPVRLNQIFINLIGNGIKFTERGEVSFSVQLIDEDEMFQKIRFVVRDTGIGIDEDKISTIFDSFSQADPSIARKYGGTGLGLTITRRLVHLMNGEISLTSRRHFGTEFQVILKLERGNGIKEKQSQNKMDLERIRNIRLLIAEDNDFNKFLMESILDDWPVIYTIVNNGIRAVDALREKEFDIVLMDIQMPEMSGVDATKVIRRDLKLTVPIVALTANAMEEDKRKYLDEGMNDYLSKPFKEEELYHVISKVSNIDIPKKENLDKKYVTNKTGLELKYVMGICKNDPEMMITLLEKMSDNLFSSVINNELFKSASIDITLSSVRSAIHDIRSSVILLEEVEILKLIDSFDDCQNNPNELYLRCQSLIHKATEFKKAIDQQVVHLKNSKESTLFGGIE